MNPSSQAKIIKRQEFTPLDKGSLGDRYECDREGGCGLSLEVGFAELKSTECPACGQQMSRTWPKEQS